MFLLFASFLAGVLTSLAPCILPLLPVIVGSSVLKGGSTRHDRRKPYIIAASLAVSVVVFTLLLKASSLLVHVDPRVWTGIAGAIVILLGTAMFFPLWWAQLSVKIGLEQGSNKLLTKANTHSGMAGAVLTGAALGPVFSSCSPVYALVLATVLPVNLGLGLAYVAAYALGLGLALLAIALAGRRLARSISWAVNPDGAFRKVLAVLLVLVGILVVTGTTSHIQTWAGDHLPFSTTALEEKLLPSSTNSHPVTSGNVKAPFNVEPYAAPAITGIADWVNSNPQTIANLKGKVVLIDFWTYSCINCQRTQPYLNAWYDAYQRDGFTIIGVHAPEFAFEKVPANVHRAVQDEHIKYPVALDNNYGTWNAYGNQHWPAKYLIDANGNVRYTQFGEGGYNTTETAIQKLLAEAGHPVSGKTNAGDGAVPVQQGQTPETYLGYERGERFASDTAIKPDASITYTPQQNLAADRWSLGGAWQVGAMDTSAKSTNNTIRLNFSAKEVYLVMDGPAGSVATVVLNGTPVTAAQNGGSDVDAAGNVHIDGPRLYRLVKLPAFANGQTLEVHVPQGATVNAFTFGG